MKNNTIDNGGKDERSKDYLENALIHYLDFLSQVSLLKQAEEQHLTRTLAEKKNDPVVREEARRQLIEANLRLVLNIAKQYRHMGNIPFADLISEGNIGLMTAIDKFKPELGHRLSTYATWWIRQRILRYIISNQSIIRVPEHIIDKINKLRKESERFRQKENREPTIPELAQQTYDSAYKELVKRFEEKHKKLPADRDLDRIKNRASNNRMTEEDILKFSSAVPYIMSLEGGFEHSDGGDKNDSSQPIAERIPGDNELFLRTLDQITVRSLLKALDEKERDVICRRFGIQLEDDENGGSISDYDDGATLESLAQRRGVSRERIRQIEREALRKMRKAYLGHSTTPANKRKKRR